MPVAAVTPACSGVSEAVVGETVDKFTRCDVAQLAVVDGHLDGDGYTRLGKYFHILRRALGK